jgi:hypothetical protein
LHLPPCRSLVRRTARLTYSQGMKGILVHQLAEAWACMIRSSGTQSHHIYLLAPCLLDAADRGVPHQHAMLGTCSANESKSQQSEFGWMQNNGLVE